MKRVEVEYLSLEPTKCWNAAGEYKHLLVDGATLPDDVNRNLDLESMRNIRDIWLA